MTDNLHFDDQPHRPSLLLENDVGAASREACVIASFSEWSYEELVTKMDEAEPGANPDLEWYYTYYLRERMKPARRWNRKIVEGKDGKLCLRVHTFEIDDGMKGPRDEIQGIPVRVEVSAQTSRLREMLVADRPVALASDAAKKRSWHESVPEDQFAIDEYLYDSDFEQDEKRSRIGDVNEK